MVLQPGRSSGRVPVSTGTDAPESTEVEWQFDALDLRPVERWLAGLPGSTVAQLPGGEDATLTALAKPGRRLVDRYLDTEDWRVGRAGYVLRTRRRGHLDEATVKNVRPATTEGLRRRIEVTETLAAGCDDVRAAPGPVGTRTAAMAGRHPLREVLEVRTRRRPFSLRIAGTEVAELALDDTTIGLGDGQHPVRLRRVEVEVDPAWVHQLDHLVADLAATCGLRPATLSKFEAGLLTLGLAVPGPADLGSTVVSASSTVGELAYASLRGQLQALLAHEPGTRLGEDPEELHDMRVATRRLRAAMDLFADVLPVRAAGLRNELGWLADVLGTVRDLDVQLERVGRWAQEVDTATARGSGGGVALDATSAEELRTLLVRRRLAAREVLLGTLDSGRYEKLASQLAILVRRGALGRAPIGRQPAVLEVPDLLESRHRAVTKAARRAARTGEPADYHRVRIRGKRLRYALEFAAPLYQGTTERFVRSLVRLQDHLGLMQDAEVAMANLRALALDVESRLSPTTVFAMGALAEQYRAEAAALLARVPKRLGTLSEKEWRRLDTAMDKCRAQALIEIADRAERTVAAHRGATSSPNGSREVAEAANVREEPVPAVVEHAASAAAPEASVEPPGAPEASVEPPGAPEPEGPALPVEVDAGTANEAPVGNAGGNGPFEHG